MALLPPDPIYVLRGDMGPVHSLLFRLSPYIEHLYAGAENGNIHIWDLKKHRQINKLTAVKHQCIGLHIIDDEYLFVQRKGGTIDIWNANGSNWTHDKTIDTDYIGFCKSQIMTDDIILIALSNSQVGALSLKTQKIVYKLDATKFFPSKKLGEVMAIKNCMLENDVILVAYESGIIAAWDIREKNLSSWLDTEICPMSLDFDNNWMRGLIGNPTDKLEVFVLNKNNELSLKSTLSLKNSGTSIIASRPDSKIFTAGGWDGRLRIFSWKTLRPLVVLTQHRSTIFDIIYSKNKVEAYNNKNLMAAAGKDGTISLWDLYNQ